MSADSSLRTVHRLRAEIEVIDRSIVLLLGARRRAQHRLLAWKEAAGLPGIDIAQEGRVLARAAGWARASGADEALATEVIRLALTSGKEAYSWKRGRIGPPSIELNAPRARSAPGRRLGARVNSG